MRHMYALFYRTYSVFNKLIRGLKSVEWLVRKLAELRANITVRFKTSLPTANGTDI